MANKTKQNNGNNNNRSNKSNYRPKGDKVQGRQKDVIGTPYSDQDQMDRQNSTKQQRRAAEAANTDAKMSQGNPVTIYKKYDRFVTDAANLPFAKPVGSRATHSYALTSSSQTSDSFVPGVMRIEFVPAIGVSRDFTSPINRSSIRFYTYLRSNQKASATYDHQDVTMMEVALDSCYMFHGMMSKIYAVINQFTPANEYYSRAIVEACGADFEDIRANLQDFRAYINAFAYSLGQYALPKDIELFFRHRWMVEGEYVDSESVKAQTYLFVPLGFWLYDNTVETGSQCTFLTYIDPLNTVLKTYAQLRAIGDQLLNAVSNEEDFAVISGDIYNFYGGETYKLPYIDENYSILPAFDETVLSQIENATLVGDLDPTTLVISQNPATNQGAILFTPKTKGTTTPYAQPEMNFHWDRPTPDQVIEATRLMSVVQGGGTIATCGTEIVTGATIFTRTLNDGAVVSSRIRIAGVFNVASTATLQTAMQYINQLLHIAQFDWAPQVQVWQLPGGDVTKYTYVGTSWDVDNYDTVPVDYIANIHLGCLLSLFKVGTNTEE